VTYDSAQGKDVIVVIDIDISCLKSPNTEGIDKKITRVSEYELRVIECRNPEGCCRNKCPNVLRLTDMYECSRIEKKE